MLLSTGNLYVTQHFGQLYFMAVFTLYRIAFAPARKPLQLISFKYSCYFIDRLVLIGNHRDAWVFGGIDPSSGTACIMEVAKALGQRYKQGRKQTCLNYVCGFLREPGQLNFVHVSTFITLLLLLGNNNALKSY